MMGIHCGAKTVCWYASASQEMIPVSARAIKLFLMARHTDDE